MIDRYDLPKTDWVSSTVPAGQAPRLFSRLQLTNSDNIALMTRLHNPSDACAARIVLKHGNLHLALDEIFNSFDPRYCLLDQIDAAFSGIETAIDACLVSQYRPFREFASPYISAAISDHIKTRKPFCFETNYQSISSAIA